MQAKENKILGHLNYFSVSLLLLNVLLIKNIHQYSIIYFQTQKNAINQMSYVLILQFHPHL